MAFPTPDHLPRKGVLLGDVSSKVLPKIAGTTSKSLTAELALEWLEDLEEGIHETKSRIYGQICDSFRDVERQLESSKSVQLRTNKLTANVKELSESLSNPEIGLLPRLLSSLNEQSALSQSAHDADVEYEALLHLSKCCHEFDELAVSLRNGSLVEGSDSCLRLRRLVEDAPEALANADVMLGMRRQLRAFSDQIDEQLSDACRRGICISSTEFHIIPSIQVRKTQTTISLKNVLSRLSDISLESFLNSLRRDITTFFIDFPAQRPVSTEVIEERDDNGIPSICLSIFPLSNNSGHHGAALQHFRKLFTFLSSHLFPVLPYARQSSFRQALCKPAANAILKDTLNLSLPSTLSELPDFLQAAHAAVIFEQEYLKEKDTKNARHDVELGSIETWVRDIASHYGRKRRISLLGKARALATSSAKSDTVKESLVRAEVLNTLQEHDMERRPKDILAQHDANDSEESPENGWDFDNSEPDNVEESTSGVNIQEAVGGAEFETKTDADENGWCFDDDLAEPSEAAAQDSFHNSDEIEDAWGWGDGDDLEDMGVSGTDESRSAQISQNGSEIIISNPTGVDGLHQDNAWNALNTETGPPSIQPQAKPVKVAKRFEKLSAKEKDRISSSTNHIFNESTSAPIPHSPAFSSYSTTSSSNMKSPQTDSLYYLPQSHYASPKQLQVDSSKHMPPVPAQNVRPIKPETYSVTKRAESMLRLLSDIFSEGREILRSKVFLKSSFSQSPLTDNLNSFPSTLVFQTAPLALDLYRAVYPVTHAAELLRPERALLFSNDCMYMCEGIANLDFTEGIPDLIQEQIRESQKRLRDLNAWWFDEGIERQREFLLEVLARANGFVDMGDQDRFDECESVMSDVLCCIRASANQWKAVLSRSMYFRAVGQVVQAVLMRVLEDVLTLLDIPELESRRLSELCRILNSLEGLFIDPDDPAASSMVLGYVPTWLKYSYLSELLEASIADIAYLFDEGALIDFQVDELEHLVRALFADTPLRANTILRLQRGHPVSLSEE